VSTSATCGIGRYYSCSSISMHASAAVPATMTATMAAPATVAVV